MNPFPAVVAFVWAALLGHASAVEFSAVEFAGKRFTVCRVDAGRERLELFHRDEAGQAYKTFDRLAAGLQAQGRKPVFAMNAGMFHPDYSTVGLLVADGRQETALNTNGGEGNFFLRPNGVFALTESGPRVVETSEYPGLGARVRLATQSGPLLVCGGRLHPAFRADSASRLLRNGVGVPSPGVAAFVISEDAVNFYEFATFFRDKLGCPDALYFDGVVSSLYAPALGRDDHHHDLGPMIAVTE